METEPRQARGTVPLLLVSVVIVMVICGAARGYWLPNLHNGILAVAFASVGAYVLQQRPGHREGMLFMAVGAVEAVIFLGRQVGHFPASHFSQWWAWLGVWPVVVALALITIAVICFPDGHLPSPGWRPVVVVIAALTTVCAALSALWPVEYKSAGLTIGHPLNTRAPSAVSDVWSAIAHPTYAALQILWLVAVVLRWRSASGHVRRQLAWLAVGAACSAIALVIGLVGWENPRAGILAASLIPLAAGWAIVHGQHLAAYSALTWLSRSANDAGDMPTQFAKAVAEALVAGGATLWMGSAETLYAVGVWPESTEGNEPTSLEQLRESSSCHVHAVLRAGAVVGALSIDRPQSDQLSAAQSRLLDDLSAQGALLVEHQNLTEIISQQREAGKLERLSPRENDVLELLARGLSNTAISEELHLSIKTVEPVVGTIFMKLGLHSDAASNRRVLAALAYLRS